MTLEERMLRLNTARGLEMPASVCVKKHWHMTRVLVNTGPKPF